jgi:hypothetical protein
LAHSCEVIASFNLIKLDHPIEASEHNNRQNNQL